MTTAATTGGQTIATRRWGRTAAWISGDGPVALLAPCRVLTVTLWPTREEALKRKALIDSSGWGGVCWRSRHTIVDLRDGTEARP